MTAPCTGGCPFRKERKNLKGAHPECHARHKGARRTKIGLSKGRRGADALASGAEERRDKLRKAAGRSKCPVIRRYLNGETRRREPPSP